MLYINDAVVKDLKPSWKTSIGILQDAIETISEGDYVQIKKPYLRFKNLDNRIIAMPAFLGGEFSVAGIKWIASFPSNIHKKIPRAHALTILNNAETGEPMMIINSGMISGIRTASVSGLVLNAYCHAFLDTHNKYKVGIAGFGPIGQLHASMIIEVLGSSLDSIQVYDPRLSDIDIADQEIKPYIIQTNSWEKAYLESDIFITCTVSKERYINQSPKPGSLQLNVSLRDYAPEIINKCQHIIVDNWEEVCRENTDIESTHQKFGLNEQDVHTLEDVCKGNYFDSIDKRQFLSKEFISFNPMGLALFDIAIAKYYYDQVARRDKGYLLPN